MPLWCSISSHVFACDSAHCDYKGRSSNQFLCSCCVHCTVTSTSAIKHSNCSFIPRNLTAGDITQSLASLDTCVSLVGHRDGMLDQRCARAKHRIANFSSRWIQHILIITCYIRLCKCQKYSQQNERARVTTNTIWVWDPLTWSWLELKSLPTQVKGRTRSHVCGCLKTHHHQPVVDIQLQDTCSISPEDRVTVLWPSRHRYICFSCKSQSHWFSAIVAWRCLT